MKNKVVIFKRAMEWIKEHTIDHNGITVTSVEKVIYPEVTGYYIPTLIQWGEKELAVSYAKYLCSIQKADGSWYDAYNKEPYVFDTAQILKGLIAVRDILPEADDHILKGCDWLVGCMASDGRLVTPSKDAWGEDETFCSELIHTYCLTPLADAAKIFGREDYEDAAVKIKDYYIAHNKDKIMNLSLLSHFYAYVMEGLLELGEEQLIREAMENLNRYQNSGGGIRGLNHVNWVCSTGMFQLALVWYKLGELEKGNKIFDYACLQQNGTGGWYGSYPSSKIAGMIPRGRFRPYYFPDAEISWANKYFLDALSFRLKLDFERQASVFLDRIDKQDGRYQLIQSYAMKAPDGQKICDIGCGKGRYLKNLMEDCPGNQYYAADISESVMADIEGLQDKRTGALTNIPYEDDSFDLVYVCEALEHAVSVEAAVKELLRITKTDGTLVIIDKPAEKLGALKIDEWEQWLEDKELKEFADRLGRTITIVESVPYEGKDDGLFRAWIYR